MAFDTESDEALVARAGSGDRTAAGELVVRHSDRVMAICYRMLGERAAAEDAAQETFLRLWKSAATWRPTGAKFSTWLYRVASNVCLDRLRVRGREVGEDEAPELADGDPRADERLQATERAATVNEALAALPERQRLAITLRHYEGVSNIEAAEIMGVTVEAVESLLGRANRALKEALMPMKDELLQSGGNL
ncbi:MAG: RNA polymerase sigma factor [Alphaproteobacteria bacterium]|nr:RNA polymerase sigma factor [Alphaproteobacteria bacterium]